MTATTTTADSHRICMPCIENCANNGSLISTYVKCLQIPYESHFHQLKKILLEWYNFALPHTNTYTHAVFFFFFIWIDFGMRTHVLAYVICIYVNVVCLILHPANFECVHSFGVVSLRITIWLMYTFHPLTQSGCQFKENEKKTLSFVYSLFHPFNRCFLAVLFVVVALAVYLTG